MARIRITHIDIPKPEIGTDKNKVAIGLFLLQQVKMRFATQGVSGGVKWPKKVRDDGRAILTGRTATLLNSFFDVQTKSGVEVGTATKYAKVHQLGTVGKGGVLPTIRPRRAKALWIPLNDKAARIGPGPTGRLLLVKGKDFFFAKKVDLPPRPMLPNSENEKTEQQEFVVSLIKVP